MKLTGTGVVKVDSNYYTNDGTNVFLANTTLNFTKSAAEGNWNESATVDSDGYAWNATTKTLTLGGLYLTTTSADGIDVPAGTTIELQSGKSSIIKSGSAGSYSIGIDCYDGSDPLTIDGTGALTVAAGDASGGTLSITDGTLNASGAAAAVPAKTAVTLGASRAVTVPSGGSVGKFVGYKTVLSGNAPAITVTIGAKASTGGSSSGGGSGSTVTVPVSSNEGSAKVSVSVSGGTAKIAATDAQLKGIASGTQTGAAKIDVSGRLTVDTVVVPSKLAAAADSAPGSTGLEVDLPTGTVMLDKSALASVASKGDVKLSVEIVENSKLTNSQKSVLGSQAGSATVVDVNVYAGNSKISTFGNGAITVFVSYTLKSGENADSVTVWFINDDGTIEPKTASYANGKVTFITEHLSQYLIVDFPFTDVDASAWCYGSVAYTYNNGLFSGTSATTFSPNATTNRQMIWMVLARMDGKMPANMAEAKAWAVENGISDGSNPMSAITRQQMAAILYRYAQFKGYDTTQGGMAVREFSDYDSISAYAQLALGWAVNTGLVQAKTIR